MKLILPVPLAANPIAVLLLVQVTEGTGVYVKVMLQEVSVPTSPENLSLMASLQLPEVVPLYSAAKFAAVDKNEVGPTPLAASAANVPVNGAVPVARLVVEEELIVVFVKLSLLPPLAFTRFNTCPLGATRFTIKSLFQV